MRRREVRCGSILRWHGYSDCWDAFDQGMTMAKKRDKDLYDQLRARGLRKRAARAASQAASKIDDKGQVPKVLRSTVDDLRSALEQLERRVGASDRTTAARKAARTRSQKAAKRSATARKGARTRSASSGTSRSTGRSASRTSSRSARRSGSGSTGRSGSRGSGGTGSRSTGRSGSRSSGGAASRSANRSSSRSTGSRGSRSTGRTGSRGGTRRTA
jgi:hypothetical protein